MLNTYFGAAILALERHGGEVDRLIGDAVFATFAGDGHTARAARAALALQEATGAVAAEHPEWPRFRAGVHTGEASVGVFGTPGRTYSVVGDTVNLGARIEGLAPVGGSRSRLACARALRGATTEPLGEITVKAVPRRSRSYCCALVAARRGLAAGLADPDAEHLDGRMAAPHSSHSIANADGAGAAHSGQRCRVSPPHARRSPAAPTRARGSTAARRRSRDRTRPSRRASCAAPGSSSASASAAPPRRESSATAARRARPRGRSRAAGRSCAPGRREVEVVRVAHAHPAREVAEMPLALVDREVEEDRDEIAVGDEVDRPPDERPEDGAFLRDPELLVLRADDPPRRAEEIAEHLLEAPIVSPAGVVTL